MLPKKRKFTASEFETFSGPGGGAEGDSPSPPDAVHHPNSPAGVVVDLSRPKGDNEQHRKETGTREGMGEVPRVAHFTLYHSKERYIIQYVIIRYHFPKRTTGMG